MKAMLLAAGRGKRLQPFTDTTPKPLLRVAGKSLIQRHVEALARSGFKELVINHAHLGEQIETQLGDGARFGVAIQYSPEPPGGLETGGGLRKALPLLGSAPFAAINADILTDFDFRQLKSLNPEYAHWFLVENPPHNREGDFSVDGDKLAPLSVDRKGHTFSGIAVYNPRLIENEPEGFWSITQLIRRHLPDQHIDASCFDGYWSDIGTYERWQQAEREMTTAK